MRKDKKVLLLIAFMVSFVLPASLSQAGCLITIKAQNSSGSDITFNPKMSKATLKIVKPRVWKKVFNKKSVKNKRNIVPARSNNYSSVFKATQNCKSPRIFRLVIEQGSCQKSFQRSLRGTPRKGVTTRSLDLGDLGTMCN